MVELPSITESNQFVLLLGRSGRIVFERLESNGSASERGL
jgi:hypothetical protein